MNKKIKVLALSLILLVLTAEYQAMAVVDYGIGDGGSPLSGQELVDNAAEELLNLKAFSFVDNDTSAELRAVITDETGTGALMFGLTAAMADGLSCAGSQLVRRNAADNAFECATPTGGGDALTSGTLVQFAATTSAQLRTVLSDELGTGVLFFLGAPGAGDQVFVSDSVSAGTWQSIPDSDLATQKLQYDVTTNVFSAGTDDDVPEAGADFVNLVLTGDVTSSGLTTTVAANSVALTTDTTGNYVGTVAAGNGVAVTGADAEGSTKTVALDYSDAGADPALNADEARFTNNATTPGMLVFEGDTANAFESRVVITDPTADRQFTIPNADSVSLQSFTCAGTDKYSAVSSLGVVTCSTDDDVPEAGEFGALALTGDVTSSGLATTVAANAVALTTDTTGNYLAAVAGGAGIAMTGAAGEGATQTLALDYSDQGASPALAADACQFTSNATVSGFIVCEGDTADAFETRWFATDPTADRLVTIPNADSNTIQPLACSGTDKVSAISSLGVVTCTADAGGAGSGDNIRVEDGDDTAAFTAAVDADFEDSGDINFVRTAGTPDAISALVRTNSVALTTDTTGNYVADVTATATTSGIAVTHTPAEGSSAAVALDYSDAGADPALVADSGRFTGDATTNGEMVFEGDTANTFETRIVVTNPTADRAFTIPDADSVGVQALTCSNKAYVSAVSAAGVVTCTNRVESFCIAASDEATAITTGTAKTTFRMPYAFTLTNIRGSLNTVSSSGSPIIDVNEAGTTLMTTNKVLIDVSEKTSVTAVTAVSLTDTSLADDAEITIDVDTAGTGAKGLKICLIGYQT